MTDSNTSNQENSKREGYFAKNWVWWVAGFVVVFIFVVIFYFINAEPEFSKQLMINHEKFSAFGEFVGGVIGTIIALVTLILVFFTYKSQKEEFRNQIKEFREQKEELVKQTEQMLHSRMNEYIFKEIENFNSRFNEESLKGKTSTLQSSKANNSLGQEIIRIQFEIEKLVLRIIYDHIGRYNNCNLADYENQILVDFIDAVSSVKMNIKKTVKNKEESTYYWSLYRERLDKTFFNYIKLEQRKLEELLLHEDKFSNENEFIMFKHQVSNFQKFYSNVFYDVPLSETDTKIFTRHISE